jgi:hypothetical protein
MNDCNRLIFANVLEVKPSSDLIAQEVQRGLLEPGQEVRLPAILPVVGSARCTVCLYTGPQSAHPKVDQNSRE